MQISNKASFYGISKISIGDNTRIDDFCVLSAGVGGINIGRNVHIAVYSSLIGAGEINVDDYANISSKVAIYSSTDDFSGSFLTNPTMPADLTNVLSSPVTLGKHVIIGSGCVVLPGVTISSGAAIGALSLVKNNVPEFEIFAGTPAIKISERKKDLLKLIGEFD
ncbi:acyltransferase [Photobacterium sanctipauli]|uniref:acyltransferase n=1 Tax=Photobacterium sanctipauli TaxID=1342794 RepID=UPI0023B83CC8|nr:acyltransferase [Photobacterium sanctipauli]